MMKLHDKSAVDGFESHVTMNESSARPNPYEMLYFGKYVGFRFAWSNGMYLEMFPTTPKEVDQYADICSRNVYPKWNDWYISEERIPESNSSYIIDLDGKFIGYYYGSTIDNIYEARIYCIPGRINKEITLGILAEIQERAKTLKMQNIVVDTETFPVQALPEIPKLKLPTATNRDYVGYYSFMYSVETKLPKGIALGNYDSFSSDMQQNIYEAFDKFNTAIIDHVGFGLALRDSHTHEFLGFAITSYMPTVLNSCILQSLFISESVRRNNHGKRLLNVLEQCLQQGNINNISAGTFECMVPQFYKKQGYTPLYSLKQENNNVYHVFHKCLPKADGTRGSKQQMVMLQN